MYFIYILIRKKNTHSRTDGYLIRCFAYQKTHEFALFIHPKKTSIFQLHKNDYDFGI